MKKHLIITTLFFATVSALPAQAGLLSLGSGVAASAGSTGFGTSGHAGVDSSINTTGIESQRAHDNGALSGLFDAEANTSVNTSASTSGSNPVLPQHKHSKELLKSTVATELDAKEKRKSQAQSNQSHSPAAQSAVTSEVSSQAEANANGTYNR